MIWFYIYIYKYTYGEGNGNPLQYSCLENPMDRGGACRTRVHGVTNSRTQLGDYHSLTYTYTHVYRYTYIFFIKYSFPLWFITGSWRSFPVLYNRPRPCNYAIYSSLQALIPTSHSIPPPTTSPWQSPVCSLLEKLFQNLNFFMLTCNCKLQHPPLYGDFWVSFYTFVFR